ncbi:MAG: Flp family type IVb pilin [Frankiales bacterium]|nr:Flp family type IVb pilin [Frankiales bacterium]
MIRRRVAKRWRAADATDGGASAVEYGLLVSAIAAVIALVVFALGGVVHDAFQGTCDSVKAHVTTANC